MKVRVLLVVLSLVSLVIPTRSASADSRRVLEEFWSEIYGSIDLPGHQRHRFDWEVLEKAQPDECYYGIGDPRNLESFFGVYPRDLGPEELHQCREDGGTPKVNQAYVWGLVKAGNSLWAGTIANTHCLVQAGYYPSGTFDPLETDAWVCEMGAQATGDYRPPRIFVYDLRRHEYTDLTQSVIDAGTEHADRLRRTIGLRSAGYARGVVFLGGVGQLGQGVSMFAFDSRTKAFLGSVAYPQYSNIRQWREIKGNLYTGVGKRGGGEVLRWIGDRADPFRFETVGELDGDPAYITEHEGRIFASTWGGPASSYGIVLYMSRKLNQRDGEHLTAADAAGWTPVWQLSEYEVEPAARQGGGAIMSFDGHLYWGTMCVPGTGAFAAQALYGTPNDTASFLGTYRPITIFRGKDFGKRNQKVELLYGSRKLPKYNTATSEWESVPNNMGGKRPKYGPAGMGNFFNNYTWWMEVYDGELFVGTMDFLYLGAVVVRGALGDQIPGWLTALAQRFEGADLWRFPSADDEASPVSLSGVGNYSTYGVRTMVTTDEALYLGMANPMNLLTNPRDGRPEGGWELIRLWKRDDRDHRDRDGDYRDRDGDHRDRDGDHRDRDGDHRDRDGDHRDCDRDHHDRDRHDRDGDHRDCDRNHRDCDRNHRDCDRDYRDYDRDHRDCDGDHRDRDGDHRDCGGDHRDRYGHR